MQTSTIRLSLLIILLLSVTFHLKAQTRLGLHVTQEELNIWRERAKNGPYKTKGDVSTNSPGDWERITRNADKFITNPSADRWKGDTKSGCIDLKTGNEPSIHGIGLRDAAFVYLITSDKRYLTAVRNELMVNVNDPLNDFSNSVRWCSDVTTDKKPGFWVAVWMQRLVIGYDYVRNSLSQSDRQAIDAWFLKSALFFQNETNKHFEKNFVNREAENYTISNYGRNMNASAGKITHYNGNKTHSLARFYNNRKGKMINFYSMVGIQQNNTSLIKSAKRFVKEFLMFSTFPDGTIGEFERWESKKPEKGWQYSMIAVNVCLEITDHLARTGDYELYKYSTSNGAYGTQGGNKSLHMLSTSMLDYINNKKNHYATDQASKNRDINYKINGISPLEGIHYVFDTWYCQSSTYFKDDYLKSIYTRKSSGTQQYPTNPTGVGAHTPWSGGFATLPAKLFMFGQMEGKVWPYPNSQNIVKPTPALSVNVTSTNASCFGISTGKATATVSGGVVPYSYQWSNGATTPSVEGLPAGQHSVIVTDKNASKQTATLTISQPNALTISEQVVAASNALSNGAINLSVSGGTAPYRFKWSTGATSEDLTNLTAGQYTITLTDKNNCTATKIVTVTQTVARLSLSVTQRDVSCHQMDNGNATVIVSGGVFPYTYLWSNGQMTNTIEKLTAGTYTVTVTDKIGTKQNASVTISHPNPLAVGSIITHENAGSKKGAVNLTVSGGTAPYTFSWSNGIATEDLTGVAAGQYSVIVTDKNQCSVTHAVVINLLALPITLSLSRTDVNCYGTATGKATVVASGGVAPYSYQWSNGATTASVEGLPAGQHSVIVTDKNASKQTATLTISQPNALTISEQVVAASNALSNGAINLSVSGGTAPYRFKWSTGATSEDLTNLTAGQYTITLTDKNNCTATKIVTVKTVTSTPVQEVVKILSFTLINADTEKPVSNFDPMIDGDELDTRVLPTRNLNLRANTTNPTLIGKVVFTLDGNASFRTEANAPYSLVGDGGGNYYAWKLAAGQHTVTATPYDKNGVSGKSLTITFYIVDQTTSLSQESKFGELPANYEAVDNRVKPQTLFSPNDDSIDDFWKIGNIEQHPDYQVTVFNRDGKKVFEAKPYTNHWDGRFNGTPLIEEAYYYLIQGQTGSIQTGTVTLIR